MQHLHTKLLWVLMSALTVVGHLSAQPRTVQPNVPPERVRTMAEWEEVEALVLSWRSYPAILTEIVRHTVRECDVYILANDPLTVRLQLLSAGISLERVSFLPASFNTVWMRDYGPWTVYQNEVGTRGISDYQYNRLNRVADDLVPHEVADFLSLPLFNADESPYQWIHTGGNFLPDGLGTAYSSDLVLRENSGKTGLEIANWAQLFFGITDYRIINRLQYDTIHHLDMHLRFLDGETLAVGTYPDGVADGPWIEENLQFIRHHYRTPSGRPYRILRLQMPPHNGQYPPVGDYRTYTNSVFVNGTILVPTYETMYDTTALRAYREYYPGYNVVGIDCNEMIGALGALHCITQLVGVEHPLLIKHSRLPDTYNPSSSYVVTAQLHHNSGIASASLYYRLWPDTAYQHVPMHPSPTAANSWEGHIPPQPQGAQVQYYIEALASNGKVQRHPLPAPTAYHTFRVRTWDALPQAQWLQTNPVVAAGTTLQFTDVSERGQQRVWSFPGGIPVWGNTEDVNVTYPNAGNYNVRLVAQNPLGSDTFLQQGAIQVLEAHPPFQETFSTEVPAYWQVIPSDEGVVQWQQKSHCGCTDGCLEVPHRQSSSKLNRAYLRAAVDLRQHDQAMLQMDVAYAVRDGQHFDELRVNLVDANGQRYNIFNKGGSVLATVEGHVPDFEPTDCSHWQTVSIDLAAWQGTQVLLEIESIGDRGNTIYLDNINIAANALPTAEIAWPEDNEIYIGPGTPMTATMRVDAEDSDGEIAQVDFFLNSVWLGQTAAPPYERDFTLPAWGEYTLQARVRDDRSTEVWTSPIRIRYDFQSSSSDVQMLPFSVAVSPNPTTQNTTLTIVADAPYPNVALTLYDLAGQAVWTTTTHLHTGVASWMLPTHTLPAGQYPLVVQYGGLHQVIQVTVI